MHWHNLIILANDWGQEEGVIGEAPRKPLPKGSQPFLMWLELHVEGAHLPREASTVAHEALDFAEQRSLLGFQSVDRLLLFGSSTLL